MKIRKTISLAVVVTVLLPIVLFAAGDANEFALVDKVVGMREAYEQSLRELAEYYNNKGYADKYVRASDELAAYLSIPKLDYLQLNVKMVSPPAAKQDAIKEADILYADGVMYKEYPDLLTKKSKLKVAIARFQRIIENYPESDKADEAAYMLGEIFEGFYFKDFGTAATYFDQAGKINPYIAKPAFFKAANIYYYKLPRYEKAADRYRKVRQYSTNDEHKKSAAYRIARMKVNGLIKK